MTFGKRDPSSLEDAQFERMLFNSARQDQPAADVEAFWARLSATIDGVARLSAASVGASNWALGGPAQRALVSKWLLAGVLAGSALTGLTIAVVLGLRGHAAAPQPVMLAPQTSVVSRPEPNEEARLQPGPREEAAPKPVDAPAAVLPKRPAGRVVLPRSSSRSVAVRPPPDSSLGAQVALLDAAQTAVAAGMFGEALRLANQYRTDFPDGELAPEAEVVAIEALAARGDSVALTQRATRFLARHPSDPHVARVTALAR
jgi:hypothetical protein